MFSLFLYEFHTRPIVSLFLHSRYFRYSRSPPPFLLLFLPLLLLLLLFLLFLLFNVFFVHQRTISHRCKIGGREGGGSEEEATRNDSFAISYFDHRDGLL